MELTRRSTIGQVAFLNLFLLNLPAVCGKYCGVEVWMYEF
jgi:hypothetical protein